MRCAVPVASATSTSPLSRQLVDAIGSSWSHGGDFASIADLVVDVVAEHIRRFGVTGVDARLAHAIADAITDHAEADYAPANAPGQRTLDDALREAAAEGDGCKACATARQSGDLGWCSCGATWGYR
jgi:hypothetical protein